MRVTLQIAFSNEAKLGTRIADCYQYLAILFLSYIELDQKWPPIGTKVFATCILCYAAVPCTAMHCNAILRHRPYDSIRHFQHSPSSSRFSQT
jgi:hypothetical protein